jgi:hypothetical protein
MVYTTPIARQTRSNLKKSEKARSLSSERFMQYKLKEYGFLQNISLQGFLTADNFHILISLDILETSV